MNLSRQYEMYHIAYQLVHNEGYHILHISDENEGELWLEKYEQKTSNVIRLTDKGYDWANHLKTDVARVFQRVKTIEKSLFGKNVQIHNVYITSYPPVDDWEDLQRPLYLNGKNQIAMQVHYMAIDNFQEEMNKFSECLGVPLMEQQDQQPDFDHEAAINHYKRYLQNIYHQKNQERQNVFAFGKPFFTYFLLAINAIMFIILEISGGSTDVDTLILLGAKFNPLIVNGEWWRLFSSMFLHIGLPHLIMNMLALYYLGTAVERMFGSKRFIWIYLLAGIGGSLTSFVFISNISAGASGAIFGLFGALLFFGTTHQKLFMQTMGKNILTIVIINIILGFVIPQIDISAHLGGLIMGFLAAAIIRLPKNQQYTYQFIALCGYALLSIGMLIFGIQSNTNSITYQMMKVEDEIASNDYEAAINRITNVLKQPNQFEAELLFQRSIAYIQLNQNQLAINDLEESVMIKGDFPEAYYNLAILYYSDQQIKKAEMAAEKAYHLKPNDQTYKQLFEQILK